jgi:hypothetical protein
MILKIGDCEMSVTENIKLYLHSGVFSQYIMSFLSFFFFFGCLVFVDTEV